jgi:GT2 family glycosyltransferase
VASVVQHAPVGSEVIVVDDASTDGTADVLRCNFPDVRLIRHHRNRGFCPAANAGWHAAQADVVELLNNDAVVTPNWYEAPLREFRDPQIGAVAPLVCRLPFRRRIDSAGDHYSSVGIARKRCEGRPFDQQPLRRREVFSASASSAFYRRSALEQVGGFPEHYGAYFDDVDLGYRLRHAGFRCVFQPESRVFHWVSQSHSHQSRTTQFRLAANSEWLFWTHLSPLQVPLWVPLHLAYLLALLAHQGVQGNFAPWFAGKCSILADIPRLCRERRRVAFLKTGKKNA